MVAFAASRAAMSALSSFWDSSRIWGATTLPLDFTSQPLDLDVPAFDLGLVLGQDRPGLVQPRLGRGHLGVGDLDILLGNAAPPRRRSPTVAFLVSALFAQLGHEQVGEHVSLLHLVADIHVPLLDERRHLGIDRRPLVALDEARLSDDRAMSRSWGWITSRTGGSETLGATFFSFAAARRREHRQQPDRQRERRATRSLDLMPETVSSMLAPSAGRSGP